MSTPGLDIDRAFWADQVLNREKQTRVSRQDQRPESEWELTSERDEPLRHFNRRVGLRLLDEGAPAWATAKSGGLQVSWT